MKNLYLVLGFWF